MLVSAEQFDVKKATFLEFKNFDIETGEIKMQFRIEITKKLYKIQNNHF